MGEGDFKGIGYYTLCHVRQGRSGAFKDSASYEAMQSDAYRAQIEMARDFIKNTEKSNRDSEVADNGIDKA